MSTIGQVIDDASAFVGAFDDLLGTDTARQAPEVAALLGAGPQFSAAMKKAGGVVGAVSGWAGRAYQVAIVADATVAVFGMLPYVASGVAKAASAAKAAGEEADLDLGMDGLRVVAEQVQGAMTTVANGMQVGMDAAETTLAFIDPPALGRLEMSLRRLQADITTLSVRPPKTPTPK